MTKRQFTFVLKHKRKMKIVSGRRRLGKTFSEKLVAEVINSLRSGRAPRE